MASKDRNFQAPVAIMSPDDRKEIYRLIDLAKQTHEGLERFMENHLSVGFERQSEAEKDGD